MAPDFAMRRPAARIRLACFAAALVFLGYPQLRAQAQSAPARSKIGELECESLVQPMGVDAERPHLSWKLHDPRVGARQTAYRILVATRPRLLDSGKPDVWDSGRVNSDQSVGVVYAGPALLAETRYYWKVQVWDKDGKPYEDSNASWWETGLHDSWHANWIGYEDLERRSIRAARPRWITNPAVLNHTGDAATQHDFRLSFNIPGAIKRAALYVTGEDSPGAWINGEQVVTTQSQPKWGRTPWRTYSRADATRFLHAGNNLLAVEVLLYAGRTRSETPMSAELYLEMADGTVKVITTDDPGWKAAMDAPGPWYMPSSNDSSWALAVPFAAQPNTFGAVEPLGNPLPTGPVVALRHDFNVAKPVRSARLFATALGAYKFHLNGQAVGDQVLSPGWTDFREHVTYQEYDVTSAIRQGENTVGAYLAPGWYSTPLEWIGQGNNYGDTPPALRAELRIEHTDGSVEWVMTNDSWKADDSPIEKAEIYDGETYDARKEQPGWDTNSFSATWRPAAVIQPKPVKIEWQAFQPIRAAKLVPAVSVNRLPDGRFIYDFGQNLAGVARIAVQGKAGTEVTLRFGEELNPDGSLYTENLRNAKATDHFILSGHGTEEYQPLFTFHGFRYVEVSGIPEPLPLRAVTAVVLHTDAPNTIELKTGNEMVNKLWSNIRWGQWSNFVGVPTDCPQRDERLGWSADAQVFWRTASYNMDLAAFSRKYAADLRGTQEGTPMYGIYAPGTARSNPGFGSGWSDAGVIVPWTSWIQTGDQEILSENWNGMKQYVDAIESANPDYLWKNQSGIAFGDWLSPEGTTSQVLISTAYWAYDVTLMKQMAHALGKTEDERKYADEFARIQTAFDHEFVRSDGFVGLLDHPAPPAPQAASDQNGPLPETQTGYVLALHMNLLPLNLRPLATRRLVDRIAANGWRLGTGFLGTPYLLEVLSEGGYPDVAYRLLLNVTYPSWGYMVEHGATTMWERWNGDAMRPDPGMNSYNHYAYGAVAEWIYRYAAGIDTDTSGPGLHEILLHPEFDSRLGSIELSYESPYGTVSSSWHIQGETALWDITIPANSTARLSLTPEEESRFRIQGKPLDESAAIAKQGQDAGRDIYRIPAGHFSFAVHQPSSQP